MRLLHVSDFHGRRDWFDWLAKEAATGRYQACCFTGDLLDALPTASLPLARQITWVRSWLQSFSSCPLLICSGNHDWWSHLENPCDRSREYDYAGWLNGLPDSVLVDFPPHEIDGHLFQCRGWGDTTELLPADPSRPLVLLCHAPPDGLGTAVDLDGVVTGDFAVGAATPYLAPRSLIVSGHVHRPACWHDRVGRVHSFNPGRTARASASIPNHIVIDIDAGRAEARQGSGRLGPVRLW